MRRVLHTLLATILLATPLGTAADVKEGQASISISITNNGVRVLPPESETRSRLFVHEERPSHRTRIPACQGTTNDAVETYGLTGWQMPPEGLAYHLNLENAPGDIRGGIAAALERAAATWTGADADKHLALGGAPAHTRSRYDGINLVTWRRLPRGTIAAARIWYSPVTGEVLDADMIFNTRARWTINDPGAGDCAGAPSAYDFQAVATHEFGHWIGLDDLYDPATADLTMHGIVMHAELKKVSLGAGDRLGATAVVP